jgi:hypothetical protein
MNDARTSTRVIPMDARLARRGLVRTSALVGAGLPSTTVGMAPPAAAQDMTPAAGTSNTGTLKTRIGPLAYINGYPTNETAQLLYDAMDFQRACQACVWAIPAMGFSGLRNARQEVLGTPDGNMCAYFDFDDKIGMLTPNITTA